MNVTISNEFQQFARQQIEAGVFSSEQEAVDVALENFLADSRMLRESVQQELDELDRGGGVDGRAFMAQLLVETKARFG